jgi:hypothetical protein
MFITAKIASNRVAMEKIPRYYLAIVFVEKSQVFVCVCVYIFITIATKHG